MKVSRRNFLSDTSTVGLLALLAPNLSDAQATNSERASDDITQFPHVSSDFWNGFYDSVNPLSPNFGQKADSGGPQANIPDPTVMTQYLHYKVDEQKLRYATDITEDELLDHDGDVAVGISLSQYWLDATDHSGNPTQFRVDVTQTKSYLNILAPLAWAAIAAVEPNKAGQVPSLTQLGFKSAQATDATKKILLNGGVGKMAVNVSRASKTSKFVTALNQIISVAKMAAPLVTLPAVSVPAMSTFTEIFAYWEERTKFVMSGNLTTAVATKQAKADQSNDAQQIGLISGDYLMVPTRYTKQLAGLMSNLKIDQGYLVRKDADTTVPVEQRAEAALNGVPLAYATMRVSVSALTQAAPTSASTGSESNNTTTTTAQKPGKAPTKKP
jgi:hypothetical protein